MKIAERWQLLCAHAAGVEASSELVDDRYRSLDRLYTAWGRSYHTWQHVAECFEWLDRYDRAHPLDPDARWRLEYAIFYHDAVHEAGRDDNEERSAELAERQLATLGLSRDFIGDVATLVRATDHVHSSGLQPRQVASDRATSLSRLVRDIDLTILGAERDRFTEYERQIRDEYAHLAEREFRARRGRVLRSLLAREAIYTTQFFSARLEIAARANLERVIDRFYSGSSRGYT